MLHLAGYPFVLKVFKTAKHSDFMLSMTSRVGRSSLKRLELANAADYMSYMSGQTVGRDQVLIALDWVSVSFRWRSRAANAPNGGSRWHIAKKIFGS